jgi:hypothetical protein
MKWIKEKEEDERMKREEDMVNYYGESGLSTHAVPVGKILFFTKS